MQVAYVGNFEPSHSTENHIARALEAQGAVVTRLQEQRFGWDPKTVPAKTAFLIWTHTHSLAPQRTHRRQLHFLEAMRRRGVPTVSYHLDRYWDLYRETQIYGSGKEPFFSTDIMCSADGGNAERWRDAGLDHVWFLPGVSEGETAPGTVRSEMVSDIGFCGSWQGVTVDEGGSGVFGGYHPESHHRHELIAWLRKTYGDRCVFWPHRDQPAVRNEPLRDLYASVKVLVGDSCFSGDPRGVSYCSDRVPETIGRGGFLIHPDTPGVTDGPYKSGEHLATWPAYDWDTLERTIDHYLSNDDERQRIAAQGKAHVLANHTYEVRMRQLIELLRDRGDIK